MRPPFPGMDPWLEHPDLWLDVHNSLITAIRDELASKVAPRYFVAVEQRAYLVPIPGDEVTVRPDILVSRTRSRRRVPVPARPDASVGTGVMDLEVAVPVKDRIEEWYLEIRRVGTGKVVTVIEVLSPTNKSHRPGRKQYLRKRERILGSNTNLVEIDLLRKGNPMPLTIHEPVKSDYRILISRGDSRPRARLLAFGVRQPIPVIPIPLLPKDPKPTLDLNTVLHALYERARFDLQLDYANLPVPPLDEKDAAWARAIVSPKSRRK
jgi:Protein of unknown function (DUF4058)